MDIVRRMDERRLIEACIKKDRRAQELLYRRYYPKMMGVCLRYARDRDEAAVMVNQGFFKVFNSLERFNPEKGKLEAWIYRICLNTAIDHYRSQVKPSRSEPIDWVEGSSKGAEAPVGITRMSAEEILGLIGKLTPAYRTVFSLFVLDGLSHAEIADKLGISEGTSKSNLAKARKHMQRMVNELHKPLKATHVR